MNGIFTKRFYTPFDKDITVYAANISNERGAFEDAEYIANQQRQPLQVSSFGVTLDWFKKECERIYSQTGITPEEFVAKAERELATMLYTFTLTESQAMTLGIVIGEYYKMLDIAHTIASGFFGKD